MPGIQQLEGILSKYTNVVKGWQHRYFILNPKGGTLEYYLPDEVKRGRPRGSIYLQGAVVSPSDEDSNLFLVNSASGEIYKLRTSDSKERQIWVNGVRAVAESQTQAMQVTSTAVSNFMSQQNRSGSTSSSSTNLSGTPNQTSTPSNIPSRAQQRVMYGTSSLYDAFSSVRDMLILAHEKHRLLAQIIEELPTSGAGNLVSTDPDLLLLKATSQATIISMEQCLAMLQQQQQATSYQQRGVTGGATLEWVQPWYAQPHT